MAEVDVIIPVYKPAAGFLKLLDRLASQSRQIGSIILINTEKSYFDQFIADTDFKEKYGNLMVRHIKKEDFDHGGTRNYGVSLSKAPYFILMTDDAIPADENLVEELLRPFADRDVAMVYGRQLPSGECGVIESYTRSFNYPETSCIKSGNQGIFCIQCVCGIQERRI